MKTKEEFIIEIKKRFPFNNIEIIEFNGASKEITYQCKDCGEIYHKSRASHIYENKTLCQKCYSTRNSEIRHKFLNYMSKRKDLKLLDKIICTSQKAHLQCLKCGRDFYVLPSNFVYNAEHSCPFCGKNGCLVDETEMKERMIKFKKDNYELIEYKKFTKSAKFKHKDCGFIFSQLPGNFLKGRGCPKCNKKISIGEQKIIDYLQKNNIIFEVQKKFEQTGTKSFDFYIPLKRTLIEYQGEQHYKPINFFGGEEKFKKQEERDQEKRIFCKNNNYFLIEIPYYDQNNLDKYLSNLKGSTTIYVDSSESKKD